MPLVSVIIPVHNGEAYVENAIVSALSQQDCDVEVIVVDDASRDQTRTVIANCMANDPRLRLVSLSTQGGPSVARNAGIIAANGAWIAMLDADDAYRPGRLARMLAAAAEVSWADVVCDNLLMVDELTGSNLGRMFGEKELPARIDARAFAIGNLPDGRRPRNGLAFLKPMVRSSLLAQHGLRYNECMWFAEDYEFFMQLLLAGAGCITLAESGYLYTVRNASLTSNHGAADLARLCAADELFLSRPEVTSDRALRRAIGRHLISSRQRLHWVLFIESYKRRDALGLLRTIGHSWPVFHYVLRKCTKEAQYRFRRRVHEKLQRSGARKNFEFRRSLRK